jgi:hypothetical protein
MAALDEIDHELRDFAFDEARISAAYLCINLAMNLLNDNRATKTVLNAELSSIKEAVKMVNQL